ncbi:MAG TPA: hypothetical protein VLW26_04305 [Steroidobacteraceae bacterium]|nr:hypothetical protein [Steroidobacteraceae bacterium]
MAAEAAGRVDTVRTDLKPLIRQAAGSDVQFAVHVPHAVSSRAQGSWSRSAGWSTWHYAVRIPTAVSLSFHASRLQLPPSAVLTVRSAATTQTYRASDLRGSELWSRIQPGEALEFSLQVPSGAQANADLEIASFQAGFRALGAGAQDHPYYRALAAAAAADAGGNSGCVQNYSCAATTANTPSAQATVALVIGNLYQCTGTLLNDVRGDNTPYVLTARHCESGSYGGGNPGAAASVTVYWDAVTPCGSALGSIYDPGVATQTGATTVVEQEDAWLLRLDQSPVVADAVLAGFDARGRSVTGGYTIHHALGHDKQFVAWFGRAASVQRNQVLDTEYLSHFLEVVNQTGNIGPGASGAGLMDSNNRFVGLTSLGRGTSDPSGYESCPAPSPRAPNGSNGAADFTSLAGIWNSTADSTSTTGNATLRSVLDPGFTGTQVVSSAPAASMSFSASDHTPQVGDVLALSWNAPGATQCTASGGVSGDGWSGTVAGAASRNVTASAPGVVSYHLQCTLSGARTVSSEISVNWTGPAPYLSWSSSGNAWVNQPVTLSWSANVSPCAIEGGGVSLSDQPASGTTTTTQSTPGDVDYQITCGAGAAEITQTTTVSYVTPGIDFDVNSTDRRLGESLVLKWLTYADSCTPTGGQPNDGWTGVSFVPRAGAEQFLTTATTLGTFTYTLTCSAGSSSVQQSVTVTIENGAAYVSAAVNQPTLTYSGTPADYVTFNWTSNLSNCTPGSQPSLSPLTAGTPMAEDSVTFDPTAPGNYVFSVTCTSAADPTLQAQTSVDVSVLAPPPPTASMTITPATVLAPQTFTVSWSSTNARSCTLTGEGDPDWSALWTPDASVPSTGSQTFTADHPGSYTLGVSCQSIDPNQSPAAAQATVTVMAAAQSPPVAPAKSGGGGGGALGALELGLLGWLLARKRTQNSRVASPAIALYNAAPQPER